MADVLVLLLVFGGIVAVFILAARKVTAGVRRGFASSDEPGVVEDLARGARARARAFRLRAEADAKD